MSNHEKSDKYFKWLLIFAVLYFLGHFFASVARAQQPTPQPPIIQCWNNGFGTIQCIQL
jgi:Na+-driven multidrug efflux pump